MELVTAFKYQEKNEKSNRGKKFITSDNPVSFRVIQYYYPVNIFTKDF